MSDPKIEPAALAAASLAAAVGELAQALALPESPMRRECFDVRVRNARVCAERALGYISLISESNHG